MADVGAADWAGDVVDHYYAAVDDHYDADADHDHYDADADDYYDADADHDHMMLIMIMIIMMLMLMIIMTHLLMIIMMQLLMGQWMTCDNLSSGARLPYCETILYSEPNYTFYFILKHEPHYILYFILNHTILYTLF